MAQENTWAVVSNEESEDFSVVEIEGSSITRTIVEGLLEKEEADLIAAAPDMLKALQLIMKHFPKSVLYDQMEEDYDAVTTAIAKAEGGTP